MLMVPTFMVRVPVGAGQSVNSGLQTTIVLQRMGAGAVMVIVVQGGQLVTMALTGATLTGACAAGATLTGARATGATLTGA